MLSDEKLLWKTEIGSRMWGMETFASDYDWFYCVQVPTRSILEGKIPPKSEQKFFEFDGKPVDATYMEIGHFINLILKGNINMIWAITSPCVHYGDDEFKTLREIVLSNLSSASYPSIRGMTLSQMSDATKRSDVRDPCKSLATALRTVRFGCAFMRGRVEFEPVKYPELVDDNDIEEELVELNMAFCDSKLPPSVPQEPFRNWLYEVRINDLDTRDSQKHSLHGGCREAWFNVL